MSMVLMKMKQTKTAICDPHAMQNNLILPTFLFKSNTACIYNYTIPRVVQLRKIVPYKKAKNSERENIV